MNVLSAPFVFPAFPYLVLCVRLFRLFCALLSLGCLEEEPEEGEQEKEEEEGEVEEKEAEAEEEEESSS